MDLGESEGALGAKDCAQIVTTAVAVNAPAQRAILLGFPSARDAPVSPEVRTARYVKHSRALLLLALEDDRGENPQEDTLTRPAGDIH